ncbi:MAG: hypothetical protein LAN62_02500 [Acidobacteriia bacterium]|nr:hypothetical protein [Terriglobia bacterium]
MPRLIPGLAGPILAIMFLVVGLPELRSQATDRSSPAERQEMQGFRQFLTKHPWIAKKLQENPSLANNQGFLHDNPELPQFLNAHPFVQSSIKTDAGGVMSRAQQSDWPSGDKPANYQEMQDFQQFLANHPWIANKVRQNPSLANDADFLKGNRELPEFLNVHPYIQSSLKADAMGFMLRMQDFAAAPPAPPKERPEALYDSESRQAIRAFQDFLDAHTWLASNLQDDPALANNQDFLNENDDFREFLKTHPYVQHALQSDATGFMLWVQQQNMSPAGPSGGDWDSRSAGQQKLEVRDLAQFLNDHPWIADKLRQNPALANSREFMYDNPPLAEFLNSHPYVQSQFRADPDAFMERARAFATGAPPPGPSRPHASDYESLNLFMQNHQWIANQLKEKPSRATSTDFLNENKELRDFLRAHPFLQDQFKQDARRTIDRALRPAGQYY